jgi:flagellar biosynthesis/type III secretory pathway M-ring protein FliF/YscJ
MSRERPQLPDTIDARTIERAYARGELKSQRMEKALDTIARQMERDPESLARVLRHWMRDG